MTQAISTGYLNPGVAAVIPISTTTSASIATAGMSLCGLFLPAVLTGTALSFLVSNDNTNFFELNSTTSGTALVYTVTENTYQAIDPKDFAGVLFFKIVSNATEVAARTFGCQLKGI